MPAYHYTRLSAIVNSITQHLTHLPLIHFISPISNNTNRPLLIIPPTGRDLPGYERLVYSFESPGGDAFFAVLDPYYLTADDPTPNLTGTFDNTQLDWLAAQVAQTKATHKFLFTHGPYYYVTSPRRGCRPSGYYLYEAVEYPG